MSKRVGFLVLAALVAAVLGAAPADGQESSPPPPSERHRVIVEVAPGSSVEEVTATAAAASEASAADEGAAAFAAPAPEGETAEEPSREPAREGVPEEAAAVVERVGADRDWVALEVDDAGLEALEASGQVQAVHPNQELTLFLDQSVPRIGADHAQDVGFDGSGKTIVVVDTGIDATHPALDEGAVVAEACFASVDCATSPDGQVVDTSPGAGAPCDLSRVADCEHGTHVAGIAASRGGGGAAPGVAPGAALVSVRIFDAAFDDEDGAWKLSSDTDDLIAALEWIADNHQSWAGDTVAVNLSLGYRPPFFFYHCDWAQGAGPMAEAVTELRAAGIMTVAATGNDAATDSISVPSCLTAATPVSATNGSGLIASYANRSPLVDLVAPGTNITSAEAEGSVFEEDGTSMAAPHVSGVAALMKEAEPGLSVSALEERLRGSGIPVADTASGHTYSRIRVDRALCDIPRRAGCVTATAGNGRATVRWGHLVSADSGVTRYRIRSSTGASATVAAGVTAHAFTGLTNGQRYTFTVEALDGGDGIIASGTSNGVVPKPPAGASGFADVPPGAYFDLGVRWARAEQITTGVGGSNVFAPAAGVTRGELVTFLWRMAGRPTGTPPHGFVDVNGNAYYEPAIRWAAARGITTGIGGGNRFDPDGPVTRGQLITFLWRSVGQPTGYFPHGFPDPIPGFAERPLEWATFHTVTTGYGNTGTFRPDVPVSRGEAVTFLRRAAADPATWKDPTVVPHTVIF